MRKVAVEFKGDKRHGWRYALLDFPKPGRVAMSPMFASVKQAQAHLAQFLADVGGSQDEPSQRVA